MSRELATKGNRAVVTQSSLPEGSAEFDPLWTTYWRQMQDVGPLMHTRYRLMLKELPMLSDGARVLDVGCGTGTFLQRLRTHAPQAELHGIEISEEACRFAAPEIRPSIRCGNILELAAELKPASFDLIVCSEVLEHVPDPLAVVRTATSLLKVGGTAVLTVPAGMKHWCAQDDAAGHLRRFEIQEFAALLVGAGLSVERLYTWGGPIGTVYNKLIDRMGPGKAASVGQSRLVRFAARAATLSMRFDDLFISSSRTRFQLVARADRRA